MRVPLYNEIINYDLVLGHIWIRCSEKIKTAPSFCNQNLPDVVLCLHLLHIKKINVQKSLNFLTLTDCFLDLLFELPVTSRRCPMGTARPE